jgi:Flp pilus assembly protein TadD
MTTRAEALRAAQQGMLKEGLAAHQRGDIQAAEKIYRGILRRQPDHFEALLVLGKLLLTTGRPEEALEPLRTAAAIAPDAAAAQAALGHALFGAGDKTGALACHDLAVTLDAADADIWSNRGNVLRALNRDREAIESYDRALALVPDHAQALGNRANALMAERRLDEASTGYQEAIRLSPDNAQLNWNYSHLLLLRGDYTDGWRRYEWRKRLTPPLGHKVFAEPVWTGQQEIHGKSIFLWWEQGFGDTLQFVRYAGLIQGMGGRVLLTVQNALAGLIGGSYPVIDATKGPPAFDYHSPLISLPLTFGTTVETIPFSEGYLRADPIRAIRYRDRMSAIAGLKVGLVWISGATARGAHHDPLTDQRTIPAAALAPLADVSAVRFVSLQKSLVPLKPDALLPPADLNCFDLTRELSDFGDTAALIDALDLVITVDTSVAHLAGALGKPVWILLHFGACWRWLDHGSTSPWYATARLFRQPAPGDWSSVVQEVAAALTDRAKTLPLG